MSARYGSLVTARMISINLSIALPIEGNLLSLCQWLYVLYDSKRWFFFFSFTPSFFSCSLPIYLSRSVLFFFHFNGHVWTQLQNETECDKCKVNNRLQQKNIKVFVQNFEKTGFDVFFPIVSVVFFFIVALPWKIEDAWHLPRYKVYEHENLHKSYLPLVSSLRCISVAIYSIHQI